MSSSLIGSHLKSQLIFHLNSLSRSVWSKNLKVFSQAPVVTTRSWLDCHEYYCKKSVEDCKQSDFRRSQESAAVLKVFSQAPVVTTRSWLDCHEYYCKKSVEDCKQSDFRSQESAAVFCSIYRYTVVCQPTHCSVSMHCYQSEYW